MKQINLFIDLIRLKKPIGFMLLFWPCAWGLTVAYDFSGKKLHIFFIFFYFYLVQF
jgi:4-hydroxybenzoate polyprenyltransferase